MQTGALVAPGDLTGLAQPGDAANPNVVERTTAMGWPFHKVTTQFSSPFSHCQLSPTAALSACTCSKLSLCMKCQYSPSA